jgi:hypothetical protein
MGTVGSGGLVNVQNGNPVSGGNLGTGAATANIANPAPNSVFVDPDHVFGKLDTITLDAVGVTGALPGSSVSDTEDVPTPAEAAGKGAGNVDIDFEVRVQVIRIDEGVPVPSMDPVIMTASDATGAYLGLAETGILFTSDSALPLDPAAANDAQTDAAAAVIMTSMLATYSANLALGGAVSKYGTTPWAARQWPPNRRSIGSARSS